MGRPILAAVCLLCLAAGAGENANEPTPQNIERWISELDHEDYQRREQATRLLGQNLDKTWDRLDKLREQGDRETALRAAQAMYEPTRRMIEPLLLKAEGDAAALEKTTLKEEETYNKEREAWVKKEQDASQKNAQGDLATAINKLQEIEQTYAGLKKQRRVELYRLQTTAAQLRMVALNREVLTRDPNAKWDLSALPFKQRLRLPFNFEFIDTPLVDALAEAQRLSGITIEVSEKARKDDTPINLRVTDMPPALGVEWICRMAEMSFTIDHAKQKIIIRTQGEE